MSPFKPVGEQAAGVVTPYKKDEDVSQSSDSSSSDSESDTQWRGWYLFFNKTDLSITAKS